VVVMKMMVLVVVEMVVMVMMVVMMMMWMVVVMMVMMMMMVVIMMVMVMMVMMTACCCIIYIEISPTLKLHYYRALLELLLKQKVTSIEHACLWYNGWCFHLSLLSPGLNSYSIHLSHYILTFLHRILAVPEDKYEL
jgi:hypothetical protein